MTPENRQPGTTSSATAVLASETPDAMAPTRSPRPERLVSSPLHLLRSADLLLIHFFIAASSPLLIWLLIFVARRLFGDAVAMSAILSDVYLYFTYAGRALTGEVPYRDFQLDYPPLSFPLFYLPGLIARTPLAYAILFGLEMLLASAILVWLLKRTVRAWEGEFQADRRMEWYTFFLFALSPFAFIRFDLVPATLLFASMAVWVSGRRRAAGALAAMGTLVKIFPGIFFLFWLAVRSYRAARQALASLAVFVIGIGLGGLLWVYAAGGADISRFLAFHTQRGLHIESLYAGFLIPLAHLLHLSPRVYHDRGSYRIDTFGSDFFSAAALPLQLALLFFVAWRFARSKSGNSLDPIHCCAAAVIAFVAFGKAFSPQYLIWAMPFLVALGGEAGRKGRGLFLAACVATVAIYPFSYAELLQCSPTAVTILNIRNVLLVLLLITLLFNDSKPQGTSAALAAPHEPGLTEGASRVEPDR